jgi:monoterpene epsilon-lactone hydrolase
MTGRPDLDHVLGMYASLSGAMASTDVQAFRQAYDALCEQFTIPDDTTVEAVDASGVPCLLVAATGVSPDRMVVYFHGGGYVIGSVAGYRAFAAALSAAAHAQVLLVDYRLAPEHRYPAAVEDGVTAHRWAAERVGAGSVVLGGESAGGGLSVAVLLALKQAGAELPAGAMCISPWTDLTLSLGSHTRNSEVDVVLTQEGLRALARAYLQGGEPTDPLVSPLFGELSGLPPVLVIVGGAETLEDDARELARRVREAGGEAELLVATDMPHAYPLFAEYLPEAADAVSRMGRFVRSLPGPVRA